MKNTMKSIWATLAVCTCLGLTSVDAASIHTPAGTMDTGAAVNVVSAVDSQTFQMVKNVLAQQPAKSDKDRETKEDILGALDNAAQYGDVYQMQGKTANGYHTSMMVAVNAKPVLDQQLQKLSATHTGLSDLGANVMMALLTTKSATPGYQIPEALEPVLLEAVNANLRTAESDINRSWAKEMAKTGGTSTVKFEDMEYMNKMTGTQYPTYTAGTRALIDLNGFQLPYYVKAYLVMNPQAPTAYVGLTSDVERQYFQPVWDASIRSIK